MWQNQFSLAALLLRLRLLLLLLLNYLYFSHKTLRDITASGRRNETPAASGMSLKDVGGVDRDIDIETS